MKKLFSIFLVLVLFFALPAAVSATPKTLTFVSKPTHVKVYGPLSFYADLSIPSLWGSQSDSLATWVHGSWPSISDATWISTAYDMEDAVNDSWRWFQKEFTLPCTAYDITGTLLATSDNAEDVYLNGDYVGSDGETQDPHNDDAEWRSLITYAINPQPGENTLDFIVRNYRLGGGTPRSNPGGLIFKATIGYEIPDVIWQPPLTNESFELKDGTTMPFKFKLHTQAGDLIIDQMTVYLRIFGPSDGGFGDAVAAFWPGEGGDFLRFDLYESYYIGNFHTKDYGLTEEATYTAVVFDGCTDEVLGTYTFDVSAGKGNRANKN